MTEQELEEELDKMYAHFESLPSPEHEPLRFKAAVKAFRYYMREKDETVQTLHDFTDGS